MFWYLPTTHLGIALWWSLFWPYGAFLAANPKERPMGQPLLNDDGTVDPLAVETANRLATDPVEWKARYYAHERMKELRVKIRGLEADLEHRSDPRFNAKRSMELVEARQELKALISKHRLQVVPE